MCNVDHCLVLPLRTKSCFLPNLQYYVTLPFINVAEGNQVDRRTPEAQEMFDVYRLLKRKEVTKDLVDQEA